MASVHTGDEITTEGEMDKHLCPPGARVLERGDSGSHSTQDSDLCCRGRRGKNSGSAGRCAGLRELHRGVLTEPWRLIHSDTGSPEAYYRGVGGGLVEEMPSLKAKCVGKQLQQEESVGGVSGRGFLAKGVTRLMCLSALTAGPALDPRAATGLTSGRAQLLSLEKKGR